jgi:carbon storage regulator
MWVISRRKGESLVVENNVILIVLEILGDKVRLGIDAPRGASVHRAELYEMVQGGVAGRPPEERAFLDAIRQRPDDEGVRLVYADWLEERGDPLAEFVRVQCRRKEIARRAQALWAEHGNDWKSYLPPSLWT